MTGVQQECKSTIEIIAAYLPKNNDTNEKRALIHKLTSIVQKNGDRRIKNPRNFTSTHQ